MGYFLLGSDGAEVTLVSPKLFESRQAALAELSRLSSSPGATVPEEVFVADLESATPVLIVPHAAPADETLVGEEPPGGTGEPAGQEEPLSADDAVAEADASVWEAPIDESIAEAIVADAEGEVPPPPIADEAPGVPLHDALRRAAGALESSGIVAPDSVGPADSGISAESADAVSPEEPETGIAAVEDAEEPVVAESGDAGTSSWPWDIAASAEPVAAVEEPAGEDAAPEESPYVPDPLEEPALDDSPLIHTGPDGPGEYEVRTVVMGSYAEAAPAVAEPASVIPPSGDDGGAPEPGGPRDDAEVAAEATGESSPAADEESEVSGLLADLEEIPSPQTESAGSGEDPFEGSSAGPQAYEGGDSDLGALTCDDCVYVNTCPKKGESDPSSCGSFQWRSL